MCIYNKEMASDTGLDLVYLDAEAGESLTSCSKHHKYDTVLNYSILYHHVNQYCIISYNT